MSHTDPAVLGAEDGLAVPGDAAPTPPPTFLVISGTTVIDLDIFGVHTPLAAIDLRGFLPLDIDEWAFAAWVAQAAPGDIWLQADHTAVICVNHITTSEQPS
jgi:hypothetical protein